MFDKFGDYMYSLLTAPMRQVRRAANQYHIFFRVVGKRFDHLKQLLFGVRESSMVVSAPDAMLAVHGDERGLTRLKGETLENFRNRLELHGQVARTAGTNEGIRFLAQSFGYSTVEIKPMEDPEKWSEATVLFIGGNVVLDDQALLLQELGNIKRARTLLHLSKEQRYPAACYLGCGCVVGRQTTLRQG